MTPADPPGDPPSGGIPRPTDPSFSSGPATGPLPLTQRSRSTTWLGDGGRFRTFLSRWGLPLFVVFVLFLGREVLLPFVFASLIAYILAPIVRSMTERKNGTHRMPRGLAIIICYLVFISPVARASCSCSCRGCRATSRASARKRPPSTSGSTTSGRLSSRAGSSIGSRRCARSRATTDEPAVVSDVPLPPGTAITMTPLPDGRYAVQLTPNGIDIKPMPDGSYHLHTLEAPPEPLTLEDKLRSYVKSGIARPAEPSSTTSCASGRRWSPASSAASSCSSSR